MIHSKHILYVNILTYAGTLPLIAASVGVLPIHAAILYASIILTFVSGMHWGVYLFHADKCPRNLLLTSNIVALLAWLAVINPLNTYTILMLSLAFIYLLLLDYQLKESHLWPKWFYHMRFVVTAIVVITLSFMGV